MGKVSFSAWNNSRSFKFLQTKKKKKENYYVIENGGSVEMFYMYIGFSKIEACFDEVSWRGKFVIHKEKGNGWGVVFVENSSVLKFYTCWEFISEQSYINFKREMGKV